MSAVFEGIVAPGERELAESYGVIAADLERSESPQAQRAVFREWDDLRRDWLSWGNVTKLRYTQDTRQDDCRHAQQELERRSPRVTSLDVRLKRRFLEPLLRRPLQADLGGQAFALWETDIAAFDDSISDDLVREAALTREYNELLANASVSFDGRERTLAAITAFRNNADRDLRHRAEVARWSIFTARRERLDAIFDELVRLRDGMGRKLGFDGFLPLGYRRMHRVDYGPADVARYRDEIVRCVVPLATELVAKLGRRRGFDQVYFWDEAVLGVPGPVVPQGDATWIVAGSVGALGAIDPALGDFATMMRDLDLLDVDNRPGKAVGAYCTVIPARKVPFVFANFNGTRGDVKTLMHELGHAFQAWSSREKPAVDYLVPTLESAEIHSMSLEYLSWPEMDRFFGADAEAYRREHLLDALLFLPYGVAVDHFQHLVYEHPSATPDERHAMWQAMERRYLPWRRYGDLEHPSLGGLWQEKQHIYRSPLYYVDYTLALCCALQFWVRAQSDRREALDAYVKLCARGGEAPFGELVRSAGLRSPFEPGTLEDVVTAAKAAFSEALPH